MPSPSQASGAVPASREAAPVPPGIAVVNEDTRALRASLGRFATGVTIMTAAGNGGGPVGLTANSFSSLSLSPPLILWSLRADSPSLGAFDVGAHFAVNVLADAQVELSRRFASRIADKFDEVAYAVNESGVPLLHGAAAWFECRTRSSQAAGDHVLFIGEVLRHSASEQEPLLFHSGHYRLLGGSL